MLTIMHIYAEKRRKPHNLPKCTGVQYTVTFLLDAQSSVGMGSGCPPC